MESWLVESPYPGMVLWLGLYISDYYMTLAAAKRYKEAGVIRFEKSLELNPVFQKDIDTEARVSKRHVLFLILFELAIPFIWFVTVRMFDAGWGYSFFLGMLLLMEVTVHMRHFRNWHLLKAYREKGGITGSITYAQWFSYKISAFDFYCFAGLYFLFFILTYSFFFLGGLVICLRIGVSHSGYARKLSSKSPPPVTQDADTLSR